MRRIGIEKLFREANRFAIQAGVAALTLTPFVASADGLETLKGYMTKITQLIIEPIVFLLFALGMFFLVFGAIEFILKADDPKAREAGRQKLIWGFVGIFIMVSAVAILEVVTNTFCQNRFCIGG